MINLNIMIDLNSKSYCKTQFVMRQLGLQEDSVTVIGKKNEM